MTVIKKRVRTKKKNGIKIGITKQTDVVAYCHICSKEVAIIKEIDERSDKEIKKIHNFRSYPASWFKDEEIKSDRVFICNKCQPGTKAWDKKYPNGEMHKTLLNHNEIKKEERKKMAEISLKELCAVGKELNEVWGLSPAIEEIERDELEARLKREGLAEMQITPKEDDVANLSKQTLSVMLQLGAVPKDLIERVEEKVGKPKKEEAKKVAKKTTSKKKTAAVKKAPVAKKSAVKKAAAPKSDGKRTGWVEGSSANVIHMAIVSAGKNGITRNAVLKKIEKKINSSNPGGRVNTILKAAIQFSLIEEKDGKYYAV